MARRSQRVARINLPSLKALGAFVLLAVLFCAFWFSYERPFQVNSTPFFYSNTLMDPLDEALLLHVAAAQEELYIASFGLTWKPIIKAINEKAVSEVAVALLLDKKDLKHSRRFLNKKVQWISDPLKSGIMHRKIIIADRSRILLGSANLTEDSVFINENLLMSIDAPILAERVIANQDTVLSLPNQEMHVWMLPRGKKMQEQVGAMIDGAKKTIRIAMFRFSNGLITEKLSQASSRGLDVSVIVDKGALEEPKSRNDLQYLLKNRVKVFYSRAAALMHHKFALIDNVLLHGSANWTHNGLLINREIMVRLAPLTDEQSHFFSRLWNRLLLRADPYAMPTH